MNDQQFEIISDFHHGIILWISPCKIIKKKTAFRAYLGLNMLNYLNQKNLFDLIWYQTLLTLQPLRVISI